MVTSSGSCRGSRMHVLDWTSVETFPEELESLLAPHARIDREVDIWQPKGYRDVEEARLDAWGPKHAPDLADWRALRDWWIRHPRDANMPEWDLVATAWIQDRAGLVLMEAIRRHLEAVLPVDMVDAWTSCGAASMMIAVRERRTLRCGPRA